MRSTDKKSTAPTTSSQARRNATDKGFFISALTGTAAGTAAGILLLLIGAAAAYSTPDPDPLAFPIAAAALYIGMFIGGVVTSVFAKRNAVAEATVAGAVINLLMLAVSAFSGMHNEYALWAKLLLHGGVFAAFLLGALAGKPRKRTSKGMRSAARRRAAR